MESSRYWFSLCLALIVLGLSGFLHLGCQSKSTPSNTTQDLVSRGRAIYMANCIACHHSNPRLSGSLGPDVYGSSLELLEARVLAGKYPDQYVPKKASMSMPAMPHLRNELPAIHAFLNQKTQ